MKLGMLSDGRRCKYLPSCLCGCLWWCAALGSPPPAVLYIPQMASFVRRAPACNDWQSTRQSQEQKKEPRDFFQGLPLLIISPPPPTPPPPFSLALPQHASRGAAGQGWAMVSLSSSFICGNGQVWTRNNPPHSVFPFISRHSVRHCVQRQPFDVFPQHNMMDADSKRAPFLFHIAHVNHSVVCFCYSRQHFHWEFKVAKVTILSLLIGNPADGSTSSSYQNSIYLSIFCCCRLNGSLSLFTCWGT